LTFNKDEAVNFYINLQNLIIDKTHNVNIVTLIYNNIMSNNKIMSYENSVKKLYKHPYLNKILSDFFEKNNDDILKAGLFFFKFFYNFN
jgi:cell fate (sporulation/competence/biofilm development) regulator YmcA (YheA/YmcA/DUF963 family)